MPKLVKKPRSYADYGIRSRAREYPMRAHGAYLAAEPRGVHPLSPECRNELGSSSAESRC